MFEPTETESLQTLEALAEAVERIVARAENDPESLRIAPQTTPVSRVDEARAARQLVPTEDAAARYWGSQHHSRFMELNEAFSREKSGQSLG